MSKEKNKIKKREENENIKMVNIICFSLFWKQVKNIIVLVYKL